MASGILGEARMLLAQPPTGDPGLWERAAVLLARQTLEASFQSFWERRAPDLAKSNMRAQLLCLAEFMGGDNLVAGDATQLWNALSRACHYDAYDRMPVASEVTGWLERTEHLCAAIDAH